MSLLTGILASVFTLSNVGFLDTVNQNYWFFVKIGFLVVFFLHGGRQFDAAPSTITALPLIAKKLKGKIPILFDSGVRSGLDIIKALVLGADFVFLGRPFIYGVAALGKFGGDLVNEILLADLHTNLMQMGVKNIAELKKFPYEIV